MIAHYLLHTLITGTFVCPGPAGSSSAVHCAHFAEVCFIIRSIDIDMEANLLLSVFSYIDRDAQESQRANQSRDSTIGGQGTQNRQRLRYLLLMYCF